MTKMTPETWPSREPAKLNERLTRIERRKRMEAPDVQRQVETLHQFGPRALLEFLAETAARNHCVDDICERLAVWSAFAPETVKAIGGDRFVPWQPLLVPADLLTAGADPPRQEVLVEGKR